MNGQIQILYETIPIMVKTDDNWYPDSGATERLMYGNVEEKISGYAPKYPFLTANLLAKVHAMCRTFIEAYDKIV